MKKPKRFLSIFFLIFCFSVSLESSENKPDLLQEKVPSLKIRAAEFKSKDGTFAVNVKLYSLSPTNYELTCTGLKKDEVIHFLSRSGKEELKYDIPFSPNMGFGYSPDVIGEKGGKSSIKIERSTGDSVEFTLYWGDALN